MVNSKELFAKLQSWDAYEDLRRGMLERGLHLHERYRDVVMMGPPDPRIAAALEAYWATTSKAYVRGLPSDTTGSIVPPPLDVLARYKDHFARTEGFPEEVARRMESAKREDVPPLPLIESPAVQNRRLEWKLFKLYAEKLGGEAKGGNIHLRKDDLVIQFTLDKGGRALQILQPQISLHQDGVESVVYINWSLVLPGFSYYDLYDSDYAAHLGVMANLVIASLMLGSLT